jgi:thioredoxin 1
MKRISAILCLVLGTALIGRAEIPAGWSTNYSAALSDAGGEQKPALFFFTASWCGPCKMMSRETLSDPAVQQTLSNIVHAAIDIDEHPDMAAKHGIEAVPTFVMFSAAGEEVRRATGFQEAGEFLQWLTNGVAGAKESVLRREIFQKKLAEVDQLLVSTNAGALRQSAAQLFDLCAERDETLVRAAAERLRTVASRQPAALLDGLNDPRLAARIQAANALRAQLGDGFDADPWADPATRAGAVEKWRAKLLR